MIDCLKYVLTASRPGRAPGFGHLLTSYVGRSLTCSSYCAHRNLPTSSSKMSVGHSLGGAASAVRRPSSFGEITRPGRFERTSATTDAVRAPGDRIMVRSRAGKSVGMAERPL